MNFRPPRTIGLIIGSFFLVILLAGITFSVFQLASETVSPFLGVWTSLVVICLPLTLLVLYRLYGLLTAQYSLNRDGFYLRWGISTDQIPIAAIEDVSLQTQYPSVTRPKLGIWWPGCMVGQSESLDHGLTEFFAASSSNGNVIIHLSDRIIVISPPDVPDFIQAFSEIVQMGSLEEIPELTQRPDFFSARLWADRYARGLILIGLVLILALLVYLAYRVSSLPSLVPFGFDQNGVPDLFVPPARLLLLPLVGGGFWLADLVIGSWLYRRERNRPIAYLVWGMGVLLVSMLWGAVINLITTS
jgi:hypothetical protein